MPEKVKKGWTRVSFGEMVQHVAERVQPTPEDGETYIGLEHLDSGSLTIRRWGARVALIGTKLRMRKGDILFARRNAYLRRVAVAPHDGLFSAHGMIVRAKPSVILPEFLPFFMQSDVFMDRAEHISVGSLSPTINWKTLAGEEFALPPLEEQRRIADVLGAIEETRCALARCGSATSALEKTVFAHALRGSLMESRGTMKQSVFGPVPAEWNVTPINSIAHVAYGISEAVASNKDPSLGWPILTGANITLAGTLDFSKIVYIQEPTKDDFVLRKGDLLLNWRSGSEEHVGKTAIFELNEKHTYASFILRIRVDDRTNRKFLWRLLNHMREFRLFGSQTSQQINFKMNAAMFREVDVIVPPRGMQDRIVSHLQKLWDAQNSVNGRLEKIKAFSNMLIEGVA